MEPGYQPQWDATIGARIEEYLPMMTMNNLVTLTTIIAEKKIFIDKNIRTQINIKIAK
jgi:hypothetical protein